MKPENVAISVPDIGSVQKPQATIDLTKPMAIEPGKGIVIALKIRQTR